MSDGGFAYDDPFPFCMSSTDNPPNLSYDFECRQSTFFTPTKGAFSGQGVLNGHWMKAAVQRRTGDVGDRLVSISAGFMMKCSMPSPDVRIVIRIDRPDGSLVEWNEKRLRADEHHPDEWERFNFEWLLRDLHLPPEDLVAIFVESDEDGLLIDDLSIVFRSSTTSRPTRHHA